MNQTTFQRGHNLLGQKRLCATKLAPAKKVQRRERQSEASSVDISNQLSELELTHMIGYLAPEDEFQVSVDGDMVVPPLWQRMGYASPLCRALWAYTFPKAPSWWLPYRLRALHQQHRRKYYQALMAARDTRRKFNLHEIIDLTSKPIEPPYVKLRRMLKEKRTQGCSGQAKSASVAIGHSPSLKVFSHPPASYKFVEDKREAATNIWLNTQFKSQWRKRFVRSPIMINILGEEKLRAYALLFHTSTGFWQPYFQAPEGYDPGEAFCLPELKQLRPLPIADQDTVRTILNITEEVRKARALLPSLKPFEGKGELAAALRKLRSIVQRRIRDSERNENRKVLNAYLQEIQPHSLEELILLPSLQVLAGGVVIKHRLHLIKNKCHTRSHSSKSNDVHVLLELVSKFRSVWKAA